MQFLVPARYSRIETKDKADQGDPVFAYITKDAINAPEDDPTTLDVDESLVGTDGNAGDEDDLNARSDHDAREDTVGQDDNGNGGIVMLPGGRGGGGSGTDTTVLVPGAGTAWTKPEGGDPSTYTAYEAERQLTGESLKDTVDSQTANVLAQVVDPSKINRVVRIDLTPNTEYAPNGMYDDGVDELIVCTEEGAYLMRSKTTDGVTKYDPPVLLSDNIDDVRDVAVFDYDRDGLLDIVTVGGPGVPTRVYLRDPTDPLLDNVGVDGLGGLRHVVLEEPDDQGAGTDRHGMDVTSVVAIYAGDPSGAVPDDDLADPNTPETKREGINGVGESYGSELIIVAGRNRDPVLYCCGSPDGVRLQLPTAHTDGTTTITYDVEDVAAAVLRPDRPPADGHPTTVVFGTTSRRDEAAGAPDLYMHIPRKRDVRTTQDPNDLSVTTETLATDRRYRSMDELLTDLFQEAGEDAATATTSAANAVAAGTADLKTLLKKLPGSPDDVSGDSGQQEAHTTHTVKFVNVHGSALGFTSGAAEYETRAHLFVGYFNRGDQLTADEKKTMGRYHGSPTHTQLDDGSASVLVTRIGHHGIFSEDLGKDFRGMDVEMPQMEEATITLPPEVHTLTKGGAVWEVVPVVVTLKTPFGTADSADYTSKTLLYDARYDTEAGDDDYTDPASPFPDHTSVPKKRVGLALLRTDGVVTDFSDRGGRTAGVDVALTDADMRESTAAAGITLAADLNGDGLLDVVSGRHVVLNAPTAGAYQAGVYTTQPLPYWTYGPTPRAVTAADVDGDGDLDLVCVPAIQRPSNVANNPTFPLPELVVLYNDGSGMFNHNHHVDPAVAAGTDPGGRSSRRDVIRVGGAAVDTSNVHVIASGFLNSGVTVGGAAASTATVDNRADLVLGTSAALGGTQYVKVLRTEPNAPGWDADPPVNAYVVALQYATNVGDVFDVAFASLTGAAGAANPRYQTDDTHADHHLHEKWLPPPQDVLFVFADSSQTADPAADGYHKLGLLDVQKDLTAPVLHDAFQSTRVAVGNLLGDSKRGLQRDPASDGTGGRSQGVPLRDAGPNAPTVDDYFDAAGTAVVTAVAGRSPTEPPTNGQYDNRGRIRDAGVPDIRTMDIVLGSNAAIRVLLAEETPAETGGVFTVANRYPTATAPDTAFEIRYNLATATQDDEGFAITHATSVLSALQVADMDGNGLDDIVLAFSSGSIYRSVLYTEVDGLPAHGSTEATACANDARLPACAAYAGPTALVSVAGTTIDDAVVGLKAAVETVLSKSDSTDPDVAGTKEMVVADLDDDGRPDVLYSTDGKEEARTTLARPGAIKKDDYPANPTAASGQGSYTDLNADKELPLDVRTELDGIISGMLGLLDTLLGAKASAVTVPTRDTAVAANKLDGTTGDSRGVINRGPPPDGGSYYNKNTQPRMRPAAVRCDPCDQAVRLPAGDVCARDAIPDPRFDDTNAALDPGVVAANEALLATCCSSQDCGYYGRQWNPEVGGDDYVTNPVTQSTTMYEYEGDGANGLLTDTYYESERCPASEEPVVPIDVNLQIDFPTVPCVEPDFPNCILLDPIFMSKSLVPTPSGGTLPVCGRHIRRVQRLAPLRVPTRRRAWCRRRRRRRRARRRRRRRRALRRRARRRRARRRRRRRRARRPTRRRRARRRRRRRRRQYAQPASSSSLEPPTA